MSSKIEWTEDTWNPLIGCDKVSAGCKNCYAIQTAWIRQHNPKMMEKYAGVVEKTANGSLNWTGKINMHEVSLIKPLLQRKPTTYFVNSMSDLFHESVPFEFIKKVFAVMAVTEGHTYQILTKRPKRMLEFFNWCPPEVPEWVAEDFYGDMEDFVYELCDRHEIETGCGSWIEIPCWPLKNVWLGVSVEDQKAADERIPLLLQVPATVRFISCEPLLGPVNVSEWLYPKEYVGMEVSNINETESSIIKNDIHWLICGGESGPDARPMHPEWARYLRNQCKDAGVPFFFKQWGNWMPGSFFKPPEAKKIGCFSNSGISDCWMFTHGHAVPNGVNMYMVGKTSAGRLLDKVEHNEYPINQKL